MVIEVAVVMLRIRAWVRVHTGSLHDVLLGYRYIPLEEEWTAPCRMDSRFTAVLGSQEASRFPQPVDERARLGDGRWFSGGRSWL